MQEYNGPSNAYLFMHDSLNNNDTQPKKLNSFIYMTVTIPSIFQNYSNISLLLTVLGKYSVLGNDIRKAKMVLDFEGYCPKSG